jgi:hypothetical protein
MTSNTRHAPNDVLTITPAAQVVYERKQIFLHWLHM